MVELSQAKSLSTTIYAVYMSPLSFHCLISPISMVTTHTYSLVPHLAPPLHMVLLLWEPAYYSVHSLLILSNSSNLEYPWGPYVNKSLVLSLQCCWEMAEMRGMTPERNFEVPTPSVSLWFLATLI